MRTAGDLDLAETVSVLTAKVAAVQGGDLREAEATRQAQAVKQWRPWELSTGPRTADGKSRSARNADNGGEWRNRREMVKMLNQAMREHRQALRKLARASLLSS